ncbi:MAG TPA: hypothetical protein DF613_16060 [Lachnospiraceae bacterium]|nr:hypothetical protein [Lachnospiraceae bacterium]
MEKKNNRIHRVGTLTFGCMLILYGILFLARLFFPGLHYEMIFRLWPVLFIFLGLEVLLGGCRRNTEFVYDKTAIVLLVFLTLFAFGMAIADLSIQYSAWYCY